MNGWRKLPVLLLRRYLEVGRCLKRDAKEKSMKKRAVQLWSLEMLCKKRKRERRRPFKALSLFQPDWGQKGGKRGERKEEEK